jgi:hypothetical protein
MTCFKRWTLCTVSFVASLLIVGLQSADARPKYLSVFTEFYPARIETAKCAICHPATKKTERSEYGTAVEEALGKKNVKDDDAIKKALKKAEGKLPKDDQ